MSIESVAIALHHSQAKGTTKLVLLGIANHDGDGGAFPKVATLAKYANIHPRRIVEHIAKLGELGEIVIHEQEGGTRRTVDALRPNMYEFVLECPADCDRSKHHRIKDEKLGRSYKGQYDPARTKDPVRVERAKKARARAIRATKEAMARAAKAVDNPPFTPSAENSTSAESSTTPSAGNDTRSSAENSTTRNHPRNHQENPGFGGTSPGSAAAVENAPSQSVATGGNDATTEDGPGWAAYLAWKEQRRATRELENSPERKNEVASLPALDRSGVAG